MGVPVRVEGDAISEFVSGGRQCSMKFFDADVERPLSSVSAIVDEGNREVFGAVYRERGPGAEQFPCLGKEVCLYANGGDRSIRSMKREQTQKAQTRRDGD